MLRVSQLNKFYGKKQVLNDVSLSVHSGETVGILGLNGAGKTTLMEIIAGGRGYDSGSVEIEPNQGSDTQSVALQPQGSALFKHLSVKEMVELWASIYKNSSSANEIIDLVGLEQQEKLRVKALSGGQQQRLRLALALVANTPLVMLDEPTVGLDPIGRDAIWDLISAWKEKGSVLISTQIMEEAEALCDRVVILHDGTIVAEGDTSELIKQYGREGSIKFTISSDASKGEFQELPGVSWANVKRERNGSRVHLICDDRQACRRYLESSFSGAISNLKVGNPCMHDVFVRAVTEHK